jgi:A/G-specific adenine glycosylase
MPGVGPYTAGAIASIAFNQPEPILDANVERVLSRMRRVSRKKGDAAYKAELWRLARVFVETGHALGIQPRTLNQALMETGAMLCLLKRPMCMICPLAGDCEAFRAGEPQWYPPAKEKKRWIAVKERLHCWVNSRGEVMLRERRMGEWRAGLWDLINQKPARGKLLGVVQTRHVVTRHKITRETSVWRVSDTIKFPSGRWLDPGNCGQLPTGSAVIRTLQRIRERFPEALPRS